MSTLTAAQTRLVTIAARGFTVTDARELTAHAAIRDLSASGLSVRAIADALKATGAKYAPSASRVGVIVKTLKALPEDVTAEDYSAALKDATRAASGDTSRKRPSASKVTAPTTRDEIAEAVAALLIASVALPADDRALLAALFAAAARDIMPTITAVAA